MWEMGGRNTGELDYSGTNGNNSGDAQNQDYEGSAEPVSSPALMAGDILHFPCSAPLCPHSFPKYTRIGHMCSAVAFLYSDLSSMALTGHSLRRIEKE